MSKMTGEHSKLPRGRRSWKGLIVSPLEPIENKGGFRVEPGTELLCMHVFRGLSLIEIVDGPHGCRREISRVNPEEIEFVRIATEDELDQAGIGKRKS